MAAPTFKFKITTPFAKNGIRQTIPETSGTTEMSYDQGYTAAYQQPPAEGGRFIEMPKINEAFYRAFAAVQELQEVLAEGSFTVAEAVKAQTAETADKLAGLLGIAGGGTGADNASQARVNLGLGNVNNTSDMDKPISTAVQAALNGKQPAGDYATAAALNSGLAGKQPAGDYATKSDLGKISSSFIMPNYADRRSYQAGSTTYSASDYAYLYIGGNVPDGWSITVTINGFQMTTGVNGTGGAATPSGIAFLPIKRGDVIETNAAWTAIIASKVTA